MGNIYHDHLDELRGIELKNQPVISLFIPLKWNDYSAGRVFTALMKAADTLCAKGGHPKPQIKTPEWDRWLQQGTTTLALYYHAGLTRLIPLPSRMQPRVVVAKSFHLKPLVTASQEYVDALLLHFNESGASLFRINASGETLVDRYLPSEVLPKSDWPARLDRQSLREFLEFLLQEVRASILPTTKLLGVTGSTYTELQVESFWKKAKLPLIFSPDSFRSAVPQNSFSIVRLRLAQMVNERHTESVMRVLKDVRNSDVDLPIQLLVPKILNREIKQLCVSLDCMLFGEINPLTGDVVVNRSQVNAADDDLLDDLVELALEKKIDVSVVPKKFLPKGRSFVASLREGL